MDPKLLAVAAEAFGRIKDPENAVLHFRRYFTLYGRATGEFDDASLDVLNLFEELIEDTYEAGIDAQRLVEESSTVIPVDDSPFTVTRLRDAYLNEEISGITVSDKTFIEKLNTLEKKKLQTLVGRTIWDLADPKLTTTDDIGQLDALIDGSKPGEGFATYLLLHPAPLVKIECRFKKFLESVAKAIRIS
jgi:hypothetical protein